MNQLTSQLEVCIQGCSVRGQLDPYPPDGRDEVLKLVLFLGLLLLSDGVAGRKIAACDGEGAANNGADQSADDGKKAPDDRADQSIHWLRSLALRGGQHPWRQGLVKSDSLPESVP